ncbi:MAG: zinc-dependent metalloprotease [Chitinophagaceae bacterium]
MHFKKAIAVSILAAGCTCTLLAQQPQRGPRPAGMPTGTGAPSVTPGGTPQSAPRVGIKPYAEVITEKARTSVGLFTVHKVEDKVYFELADSVLGRDILVVSRLAKAGVDMRAGGSMSGYAGDQLNTSVVRFERGPSNKIFMRDLSYSEYSRDSSMPMFRAVMNSNIQPIALSFDVRAYNRDSVSGNRSTVIELTDVINGDNDIFFLGNAKSSLRAGALQADKSYLVDVKTFPINTEIKTVKTYARAAAAQGAGGAGGFFGGAPSGPLTIELNTSMVLLPKVPMQPRYFDERVGYFTSNYTDFDANPQGVKRVSMIARWRLEPKPEDMEKYKRGELVEPKNPIVIYIDPATPAKWVPYLIAGINDWQAAFEKAGFKNAIIGKRAPTPQEDPTWSLDDARHSAVVYKPSSVANASGPHISDPRSGEIMETHINWYHNVMKLIHDWYMIQCAAVDPKARKMEFDDELMGQLIRFVSSHEVGHTLGLRHNWGSSSTTPVEKLRDKKWVEENGHTPSIMDYARFNYVAQPEDNITEKGLFPRIGDYDKWAIEWGYKVLPDAKSADDEKPVLNKWVIAKLQDKRYWFGTETSPDDPRGQNEDLGDNAMKASEYGIKNLKRILANLPEWTKTANEGYDDLEGMYGQLTGQFGRYIGHVSKNIGGRYETLKTVEQPGPIYELVPAATQLEAMDFLNKQVFATPTWVLDQRIFAVTGASPAGVISNLQDVALNRLVSATTINRLLTAEALSDKAFKASDLFNELRKGIWGELATKQTITIYRRNLQKSYVEKMIAIIKPAPAAEIPVVIGGGGRGGNARPADNTKTSDVVSVVKANLVSIRTSIKAALPTVTDSMTKYHLQDLSDRITNALSTKGE